MKIGSHYKSNFTLLLYKDKNLSGKATFLSDTHYTSGDQSTMFFVVDREVITVEQRSRNHSSAKYAYKVLGSGFIGWLTIDPQMDLYLDNTGVFVRNGYSVIEITEANHACFEDVLNSLPDSTSDEAMLKISQKISEEMDRL